MTYLSKSAVLIALLSPFGMANTLLDDLSICAKNSDNLQRLVCYDKLAEMAEMAENSPSNQQKVQQQIPLQVTSSIPLTQQNQNNLVLTQLKPPQKAHIIKPQSAFNVTNEVNQQQSSFGQEDKQRTKNLIKEIQAQVVLVKKGTHGKQIITLNNGQVWRQTDSTYLKLRKGQAIIIKRGAMGSFFIGKHSTNKRIRAKRIK
jgi:mannose-6-phosphate isomerase class I